MIRNFDITVIKHKVIKSNVFKKHIVIVDSRGQSKYGCTHVLASRVIIRSVY